MQADPVCSTSPPAAHLEQLQAVPSPEATRTAAWQRSQQRAHAHLLTLALSIVFLLAVQAAAAPAAAEVAGAAAVVAAAAV